MVFLLAGFPACGAQRRLFLFAPGFAALRHNRRSEYNALRHECQGFFAALRQKTSK
jgi:hypothetical protein